MPNQVLQYCRQDDILISMLKVFIILLFYFTTHRGFNRQFQLRLYFMLYDIQITISFKACLQFNIQFTYDMVRLALQQFLL